MEHPAYSEAIYRRSRSTIYSEAIYLSYNLAPRARHQQLAIAGLRCYPQLPYAQTQLQVHCEHHVLTTVVR